MNTKIIMTSASIALGITGIFMSFAPDVVIANLHVEANPTALIMIQVIGGLYFGYAMLNWMTKASLIGGIYNRPIAVANFTHFLMAGLALIKGLISYPELSNALWIAGVVYLVLALLFMAILFTHPVSASANK